jgi:hypothetical protein
MAPGGPAGIPWRDRTMRPASLLPIVLALAAAATLAPARPARATDVDGGNDCTRVYTDFGDAPENVVAYPSGVLGAFPSCLAPGPVGSRTVACAAPGTAPGPAGFVRHVGTGTDNFWLGCYSTVDGPSGVDGESDAKVQLGGGPSACGGIPTDGTEPAFNVLTFADDEAFADGSDAGVTSPGFFIRCASASLAYSVYNCGAPRTIYLNVCVDFNQDGDWNDSFTCPAGCAREWALVNVPVTIDSGCNALASPNFRVGPTNGPGWMRITVTSDPVPNDFPWNGSVSAPGSQFIGGETEDYPVVMDQVVPAGQRTWGTLKTSYR